MRERVIGERMSAREDFRDQMRMLFRAFADDKEGRAGMELLQQIKHLLRVRR